MTPIDLKADLDKVIRDIIFIPQTTFYGLFLSEVSRIFNFGKRSRNWWFGVESNHRPTGYESVALTI